MPEVERDANHAVLSVGYQGTVFVLPPDSGADCVRLIAATGGGNATLVILDASALEALAQGLLTFVLAIRSK